MSILEYNGGVVVAMQGKDCVAIACDKRFGVRHQTISMEYSKIYEISPHVYVGFAGLGTDALTVYQRLKFRVNLYELKENRKISPSTLSSMLSNLLYEHRFGPYFVEPVVVGLGMFLFFCYNTFYNKLLIYKF